MGFDNPIMERLEEEIWKRLHFPIAINSLLQGKNREDPTGESIHQQREESQLFLLKI